MAVEHTPEDLPDVKITREDGLIVAVDEETGVASQGETRPQALYNLAEAVALHERDGVTIEDPDAFLETELGIEPPTDTGQPPWLKE